MSDENNSSSNNQVGAKEKKTYTKPTIESESLNTYGALCNGTSLGGRKVSAAPVPPPVCNPSRLNS